MAHFWLADIENKRYNAQTMQITTLAQFEAFLKARIPTREALFVGDLGLARSKKFMQLLGNPQNKIKVIHIAGTSGKSSTVHLVSQLLASQGKSTSMSISPHLFDIRERFQINNSLLSKKLVLKYFNRMLPAIAQMEKTKYGSPTFFELNIALAYFMFAGEKLDYAVMETGLGGLLDATNTVTNKNKFCIITKLGLDHTEILGNTLAKIAEQKAGIIQNQNAVISIKQEAAAQRVIKKKCAEKNAALYIVKKTNYSITSSTPQKTVFDFYFSPKITGPNNAAAFSRTTFKNLRLGLIGKHQAENCSLALACLALLSKRDKFNINEQKLRKTLEHISIPGRLEISKIKGKTVIIDGAHNPQKMVAFIGNLSKIYPKQKFTFIVAFKKIKDHENMLKKIIPLADTILLTHFSTKNMDGHWSSTDNTTISNFLKSQKFKNFRIIDNKHSDILKNITVSKKPVVITGSLYLIGKIYPYLT